MFQKKKKKKVALKVFWNVPGYPKSGIFLNQLHIFYFHNY